MTSLNHDSFLNDLDSSHYHGIMNILEESVQLDIQILTSFSYDLSQS